MASPGAQHTLLNTIDFDSNNRLNVVQHSHPTSVDVHLYLTGISASQDYILIDVSDWQSYEQTADRTNYAHIENLWFDIDADATADYEITIGYLKDVNATAGTLTHLYTISGDKKVGQSRNIFLPLYPNGARMTNGYVVTADRYTESGFSSGSKLASTLSPYSATTNCANSDVILRVVMNAGSINLSTNISFHGH